jgi:WD repeat-containing protein 23
MSSSHPPTSPPSEETNTRAVVYDPGDPFWRDTEDDDDDMDFELAEEGSDETADEGESLSFHGMPNEAVMHG